MYHDIEKALDNLEKRAQDIQHYMNIMSKVKTVNVADDQDFQREFDFFYKVRRNAEWRKVFFEIFERKKKDAIIGSSNFDIFMNHLSNDDHKWIEDINEAIEAIDS